jgi:predicted nucleic acid-binding protein
MTFDDPSAGDQVFLDANILTYFFQPHPTLGPACQRLIDRIERQQLAGFTSTHVLGELAHRLMTFEATVLFGWPFAGIGNRLRNHPDQVRRLEAFRMAIERMVQSKFTILTIPADLLIPAADLSQNLGLLNNDALVTTLMQAHGLNKLASSDTDFDRVPGLVRYGPI